MSYVAAIFYLLACALSLGLCLVSGVLVFQVASALAVKRKGALPPPATPLAPSPTFAVIMPAHNEAQGIAPAIQAVLAQCQSGGRLIVVADNCSDNTAEIARAEGAQVIERFDTHLRGKGYALDFGVRHLAQNNPPEVVVVVDADCIVAPSALVTLATFSVTHQRPVQSLYLMHAPSGAGIATRIAEFAWVVKNYVRPLGYSLWGWPCQLMGSGMAFPWVLMRHSCLATSHVVEDMQLGLDMAAAGTAPMFCPTALVSSTFPSQTQGLQSQRTRWEHGHLSLIAAQAPRLFEVAMQRRHIALFAMALDLCVPPLASLVLALSAWFGLSALLWLATGWSAPAVIVVLALGGLGAAVLTSWSVFARHVISARELLWAPAYAMGKVPHYLRLLLKKGPLEWTRTQRDPGTGHHKK